MTTTTTVQVPAGWYPDPVSLATSGTATQQRWWDGAAWSTHTAPFAPPAPRATPASSLSRVGSAPTTVSPSDSARTAENMPLHSVNEAARSMNSLFASEVAAAAPYSALSPATSSAYSSSGSVGSADTQIDYEPFAHRRNTEMRADAAHHTVQSNPLGLRAHTVSIWLIATMPLTQAMLIFWVFSSLPPESSSWTRALAVALPFVLYAALAGQDTRLLESSGHLRTSHWIMAFATPPLYLAVRGVRVGHATGALPWPLIVWAVVQAGVIGVWWAVDPAGVQNLLSLLA